MPSEYIVTNKYSVKIYISKNTRYYIRIKDDKMTHKSKPLITIVSVSGLALASALTPAYRSYANQDVQQTQSSQVSIENPKHGFLNGTSTENSDSKAPKTSIKVDGKSQSQVCGTNNIIIAGPNSHVTINCNQTQTKKHTEIHEKQKASQHTYHAPKPQYQKPQAKVTPNYSRYAFVPGDTLTYALRAQRILPPAGVIDAPVTTPVTSFGNYDIRMSPDGRLGDVIWTKAGPLVILTDVYGTPNYSIAVSEVSTFIKQNLGYNLGPLFQARSEGKMVQISKNTTSQSQAPQSQTMYNTPYSNQNQQQSSQPYSYQQPQAPAYQNNGMGYNSRGYYYDINNTDLQNIQRN